MKLLNATLLCLMAFTIFSCHKENKELKKPQPLMLIPLHNEGRLSDAELNNAALYYFINLTSTHKEYVADFGRAAGSDYQKGILSSSDVAALSSDEGIKTFYLTIGGTNDTLHVDYERISDDEARENHCFCNAPQLTVLVNSHPAFRAFYNTDSVPVYRIVK